MELQKKDLIQSIGTWVQNHKGTILGKVEDIKFDTEHNIAEYLILCCQELIGKGNRYFAVSVNPSLIKIGRQGKLIIQLEKEKLKTAFGVHADEYPRYDPQLSNSVFELYGYSE